MAQFSRVRVAQISMSLDISHRRAEPSAPNPGREKVAGWAERLASASGMPEGQRNGALERYNLAVPQLWA
jgi:hypothetical protein